MAQQRQAVLAAGGIVTAGLLACVLLLASTPRTPTTLLGVMPQPYRYPKVFVAKIWNSCPPENQQSLWNPTSGRNLQGGVAADPPVTGWEKDTLSLSSTPLNLFHSSSRPPPSAYRNADPLSQEFRRDCVQTPM